VIVGLLLVNLCLYGAFAALASCVRRSPSEPAPGVQGGRRLDLQTAHDQAQALAADWHADAELVGVTTSWQMAAGDRLTLYRPAWSFSFYAPGAKQSLVVTVDGAGAQAGRQVSMPSAPSRVEADWQMDSDELLLTLMAHGGEDFFKEHSQVNIHAQLKAQEAGRSLWYLTALDPVTRQSLTVTVDARTRQVARATRSDVQGS
jgi:hypothetical protein